MKNVFWIILVTFVGLISCTEEESATIEATVSTNVFGPYFYQYDTVPKVYVYRDQVNGINEEFHRVFAMDDSQGKHIVVEIYKADGRITEALNYNVDSLHVLDHMVVNVEQEQTKAELFKNKLMPRSKTDTASFASRFGGIDDSTKFLKEVDRIFNSEQEITVLDKTVAATIFSDYIRLTLFNPFTKQESAVQGELINYFAKDYGLVEWHDSEKQIHFRLEKIISQSDFLNLMNN